MKKRTKSAPCEKQKPITYFLESPITLNSLNLPSLEKRPQTGYQSRSSLKSRKVSNNDQKYDIFTLTQLKTQYPPTVKPKNTSYPKIQYTERIKIEEKITQQYMNQLVDKYKMHEINSPYKQNMKTLHSNARIRAQTLLEMRDKSDSSQRKESMKEFDTAVKESQLHDKRVIQKTYISSKYGELRIYKL